METSNIVIIVAGLSIAILLTAVAEFLGTVVRRHRSELEEFRKAVNVEHHNESQGEPK